MGNVRAFQVPGLKGELAACVGPGSRILTHADVVVDLETLGRAPGCQVLEIGAAVLQPDGQVGHFQAHPSLFDQKRVGLDVDPATLLWWLGPELDHARAEVLANHREEGLQARPLINVLTAFAEWLDGLGSDREVRLWGNGASFDLGILGALYDAIDLPRPWKFWAERDLRTLFELRGKTVLDRVNGTTHIGRFDAAHELAQLHLSLQNREG